MLPVRKNAEELVDDDGCLAEVCLGLLLAQAFKSGSPLLPVLRAERVGFQIIRSARLCLISDRPTFARRSAGTTSVNQWLELFGFL